MNFQFTNFMDIDPEEIIRNRIYFDFTNKMYLFFLYSAEAKWVIAPTLGYQYKLDGENLTTKFYNLNGHRYYEISGYYVWFSPAQSWSPNSKWVISENLGFFSDTEDYWYIERTDSPYAIEDVTGTYTAGGTASGTKTITKELNGWARLITDESYWYNFPERFIAGEYTGVGTQLESNKKYIGYEKLNDTQSSDFYIKQLTQFNGYDTYKNVAGDRYLWAVYRENYEDYVWIITEGVPGCVTHPDGLTGSVWFAVNGYELIGSYSYHWYGDEEEEPTYGSIITEKGGYTLEGMPRLTQEIYIVQGSIIQ